MNNTWPDLMKNERIEKYKVTLSYYNQYDFKNGSLNIISNGSK